MNTFRQFSSEHSIIARQRLTALRHHCRLAAETSHPRFGFLIGGASVVLTVNSGYE